MVPVHKGATSASITSYDKAVCSEQRRAIKIQTSFVPFCLGVIRFFVMLILLCSCRGDGDLWYCIASARDVNCWFNRTFYEYRPFNLYIFVLLYSNRDGTNEKYTIIFFYLNKSNELTFAATIVAR